MASVESTKDVTCSRGVRLVADRLLEEVNQESFDLIALPGGMPGAERLGQSTKLVEMLKKQRDAGKLYAAICATPGDGRRHVGDPIDREHDDMLKTCVRARGARRRGLHPGRPAGREESHGAPCVRGAPGGPVTSRGQGGRGWDVHDVARTRDGVRVCAQPRGPAARRGQGPRGGQAHGALMSSPVRNLAPRPSSSLPPRVRALTALVEHRRWLVRRSNLHLLEIRLVVTALLARRRLRSHRGGPHCVDRVLAERAWD